MLLQKDLSPDPPFSSIFLAVHVHLLPPFQLLRIDSFYVSLFKFFKAKTRYFVINFNNKLKLFKQCTFINFPIAFRKRFYYSWLRFVFLNYEIIFLYVKKVTTLLQELSTLKSEPL